MAKGNKIQKAVLKNVQVVKVSGVFEKDGEEVAYDKITLCVDDLEFDISMDSGVKKLFMKILPFEDVEDDEDDED